jgi:rhodanese-related sulfurtransferase
MDEAIRVRVRHSTHPIWFRLGVILLAAWIGGGLTGCSRREVSDRRIDVISLSEALAFHERTRGPDAEVLFIDARRSVIFDEGHIRGAVNLRPNDVDLRAGPDPRLESKQALVVYGEDPSSAVARAMSKRLIEAGYNTILRRRVKFYAGGFKEWVSSGLPVDRTEPTPEP